MTRILAIDPGHEQSGWVIIDAESCLPIAFGKTDNRVLLAQLWMREIQHFDRAVIEMIASYGMAVGAEVFQTCVWIGRFTEATSARELITRQPVKLHHCHDSRAKDTNIVQALVDRFAPGQPNHGKGTKANLGWFHGFKADIWQAYALAVYAADQLAGRAA